MKKNEYGNVVSEGKLDNGVEFEVSSSSNPFDESYLIIKVAKHLAVGLIVEKKKDGTIEIRNKIDKKAIRIHGIKEDNENEPTRSLD